MIEVVKIFNKSDTSVCLHIGEGIDWDIDPDSGDMAGEDLLLEMIYQRGCPGGGYSDFYTGAKFCHKGKSVIGAVTLDNSIWVYPNSGYTPAEIGGLLARHEGFAGVFAGSCEDISSFYVVDTAVHLMPNDTICYCKVRASSVTGFADLRDQIAKGHSWAAENLECCDMCVPGDANGSGGVDVDDVVYLIAYIFSGGPPPRPYDCCGDANGSCGVDIDDVVYLIGYIFTAGYPPPAESCSPDSCGVF
jgi:hypothetical protein